MKLDIQVVGVFGGKILTGVKAHRCSIMTTLDLKHKNTRHFLIVY